MTANLAAGACLQEILMSGEESSFDVGVQVAAISPVSELGQSNKLPDCIPLEIKSEPVLLHLTRSPKGVNRLF